MNGADIGEIRYFAGNLMYVSGNMVALNSEFRMFGQLIDFMFGKPINFP